MLVLSRAVNESVVIRTPEGREIRVYIVRAEKGCARLGFEADREIIIDREEVARRKEAAHA